MKVKKTRIYPKPIEEKSTSEQVKEYFDKAVAHLESRIRDYKLQEQQYQQLLARLPEAFSGDWQQQICKLSAEWSNDHLIVVPVSEFERRYELSQLGRKKNEDSK